MSTDANASCLLADVEVQEAWSFALAAGNLRHTFKATQEHHTFEEFEQEITVWQVGGAFE